MRYVSAYMLAVLGGKEKPTVADIESILGSVGIDSDAEKAKMVVSRLSGKSIAELIAEGSSHLVAVSGGGGGGGAPTASKAAAPAAAAVEDEKKKPAKAEEKEEQSDEDMGFGLFD